MEESRKLAEFVQNIQLLHANLREGQLPDLSIFDKQVGEMFDTGHEGDVGAISDTIVGGKSSAVMPGPKKRTRIQARS